MKEFNFKFSNADIGKSVRVISTKEIGIVHSADTHYVYLTLKSYIYADHSGTILRTINSIPYKFKPNEVEFYVELFPKKSG